MLQASPRVSDVRRSVPRRSIGMLATVLATLVLGSASTCLEPPPPPPPPPCKAACDVEAECGFRSFEDCEIASCDPETGAAVYGAFDRCLDTADSCLDAVACACDEGCDKTEKCSGSPDRECVKTCNTLSEQTPKDLYLENFCRLESSCRDVAACGGVSG